MGNVDQGPLHMCNSALKYFLHPSDTLQKNSLYRLEMQDSGTGIIKKCFLLLRNLYLSKKKTNATIPDINHWREIPGLFVREEFV